MSNPASSYDRIMRSMRKMAPGTMGGQSLVASSPSPKFTLTPPPRGCTQACPTFLVDTLDLNGNGADGLATWDGGTKITIKDNDQVRTYSFPDFTLLYENDLGASGPPTWAFAKSNMAVTEDGIAFIWIVLSSTFFAELYRYDIAADSGSIVYSLDSLTGMSGIIADGPSWNPYDGYLYEFMGLNRSVGTDTSEIWRWDLANLANPSSEIVVANNPNAGGDTLVFTHDRNIWGNNGEGGPESPFRYDPFIDVVDFFDPVAGVTDGIAVPRSKRSVFFASTTGGKTLFSDLSFRDTECSLFESSGTARATTNVSGLTVFLYPTTVGIGTLIYSVRAC